MGSPFPLQPAAQNGRGSLLFRPRSSAKKFIATAAAKGRTHFTSLAVGSFIVAFCSNLFISRFFLTGRIYGRLPLRQFLRLENLLDLGNQLRRA